MSARDKLLVAAARVLAEDGLTGASARTIAARAEVNQALVFYHFSTVSELLEAAVRTSVDAAISDYRERLDHVTTVAGLVELAATLHETGKERGHVAQMAQVLAGAPRDEVLGRAAAYALRRWRDEVEAVLLRVLADSPLRELLDPAALATTVTAGSIGLQLYEGVDPDGAEMATDSLRALSALVDVVDGLGPVAQRVLRARLDRQGTRTS